MPTQRVKFGRDVIIAGAVTLIKSLRNLLMLPLMTHSLSVAEFGIWGQLVGGVAVVMPWVCLQLPDTLIRFLPGQANQGTVREGFFSVLFFTFFTGSAFALCSWSLTPLLQGYPGLQPFLEQAGPVLILVPLTGMLDTVSAFFRASRSMLRYSLLTLGQSFAEIALVAYVFFAGFGLEEALEALVAVRGGILLIGGGLIVGQIGFRWPHFSLLKSYLRFSIPLIPQTSFYQVFDVGDRYVLSYFLGNAAVGMYSAGYTVASVFNTLAAPLHFVLVPAMAELWNTNQFDELCNYITRSIRYSAMVLLPALTGVFLFPDPILHLVVGQNYDQAALFLPVLSLSFLVFSLGAPGTHLLYSAGHTRSLFFIHTVMFGLNIGLNILLIPLVGIWGAVLCTLLGHTIYTGSLLVMSRRILCFTIPWKALFLSGANSTAMGIVLKVSTLLHPLPILVTVLEGAGVYFALLCLTGGLTRNEFQYLRRLIVDRHVR